MEPLRLLIENFCGHENSEIDFEKFSIALVIGRQKGNDKISNAVGKSTIFSAIKYVLFNETDFSSLERIIRHGCDYCRIIFECRVNDNIYKIIRRRTKKETDLRLFLKKGNDWCDITQRRASDTEKELYKLLKINCKTFCNSVLFSQAEVINGLAALTPSARKVILKEALQLGIYSNFEKLAKKKASEVVKDLEKSRILLSTIGDPKKDIAAFEIELQQIRDDILNKNSLLSGNRVILDKLNFQYNEANEKYKLLEQRTSEEYSKYRSVQQELAKIKLNISDISAKTLKIQKSKQQLELEIYDLKSKINTYNIPSNENFNTLKNNIERISALVVEKSITYKNLSEEFKEKNIPLPNDTICKHCRQPLSQEHREACKRDIEAEILKIKNDMGSIKSVISALVADEKKYKDNLSKIEKNIEICKAMQQSISLKENELKNIDILFTEYDSLSNKENKYLQIKLNELDSIKKILSDNNATEIPKLKVEISDLKNKLSDEKNVIDKINADISVLVSQEAVLSHRKNERAVDIDKLNNFAKNIGLLEESADIHHKVVQAFGSSGIPALITHTILDDFQIETNLLLSQLRPGLQTKFLIIKDRVDGDKEDTLDIQYIWNGHELEYAQLSNAQKLLASLCLKLGLASVIKKRLGVDIKMLLIDEADSSLDDGNLEGFDEAIKKLQSEYKIMIITHNKELKDKFSTAIVVEQDENLISRAKVLNAW